MLVRVGRFVVEMCKTWGAVLTGGFLIAILASWQFTGHDIPTRVGWALIIGGVGIAAFQVWNRQVTLTENAEHRLEEEKRKQGSPLVLLSFEPIKPLSQRDLVFKLINQSNCHAYNVQIQPIVMPKSTARFAELTNLFVGAEKELKPDTQPVIDPIYRHDFIVMLHNQPDEFLLAHRTPACEGKIDPIVAIPVDITYSNSSGKEWFTTKMRILFDFDPLSNYIDTKLVETKSIPHPN